MSSAVIQNGVISKPAAPKRDVQWADVYPHPPCAPLVLPLLSNYAVLDCKANSTRVGYSRPCVFLCRHRPCTPCVCMANTLDGSTALPISVAHFSIVRGRGVHGRLYLFSVFWIRLFNQTTETCACRQTGRSEKGDSQQYRAKTSPTRRPCDNCDNNKCHVVVPRRVQSSSFIADGVVVGSFFGLYSWLGCPFAIAGSLNCYSHKYPAKILGPYMELRRDLVRGTEHV